MAWGWTAIGGLALAAWALHRASRRPRHRRAVRPELARFLAALQHELLQHPEVEFLGMLAGQFACLLRVHGQETPVSLQELHRRWLAYPTHFGRSVGQLCREIEEAGLDRIDDHYFAAVAGDLMPQVRSMDWVDAQGRFGDGGLVSTRLGPDLAVVFVIDDARAMVFVCREHLRRWGRSVEDIESLAIANLRQRSGNLAALMRDGEPSLLRTGDGYDAARVLLLPKDQDLLVLMPDRDVLWAADPKGQDQRDLMRQAERMAGCALHPVSPRLYRLQQGALAPVTDGSWRGSGPGPAP